jgi:uncharacterized membrane protein YdjX (TVP38/TMEM64 family)
MGIAFAISATHTPTFQMMQSLQITILQFHQQHPLLTPILFMAAYIFYALLSLPGIFILSLMAGFLFEQPYSTIYVIVAATIGGSLLFLAARTAFGEILYRKAGESLTKMREGFLKNAMNYLLFLRLLPLFPFWLVNVAGAFFTVPFFTFVWTTFVGMIPSVFIYTQAGKGLSTLLSSGEAIHPTSLFNINLVVGLIGLAFLPLLPIFFRKNVQK